MSFAARQATVQLPWGQLALVGLGAFYVANPEKFFAAVVHGMQLLQAPSNSAAHAAPPQPIIIHQAGPIASGNSKTGFMVRMAVGAGLCWGSYVVLITILPEGAKGLLPVNRKVFNQAVTSLGKAVINLKDTLMVQINALIEKQDELGDKQDKTHAEVVDIKGNVQDVRTDISAVQEALDLCQASLSESERRTSYIARGVQLLTRGVSTILPEDERLLDELVQFNVAGDEFINGPAPMQQRRIEQMRETLRRQSSGGSSEASSKSGASSVTPTPSAPPCPVTPIQQLNACSDPENDHPFSPVDNSVAPIHNLLRLHSQ